MTFSYANPTSGPSAGGIGWFNFNDFTISPGDTIIGLTGTLNDGSTVTFDLSLVNTSGQPRTFVSTTVPSFPGAFFGTAGYTGISGKAALYSNFNFNGPGVNTFTMSNITVVDINNNPIPNYTVILADSETTNTNEAWNYQTNGGVWNLLTTLGNNPPILTGLGTQTANISGTQLFPEATQASYLLTTQAPSQLIIASTESPSGRQAISIGFAVTRIKLQTYVAGRIDNADQFQLDITGSPSDQNTTSGIISGLQAQTAQIYATPGNTYGINEIMAPGSISQLSDYDVIVSAINATPAGSVPPIGNLPISFTPALGDDVTYIVYNAIPYTYVKTVDKAYADTGEILTYTVTIDNPNDFSVSNVQFTDSTPIGTTYIGNLLVSSPYTGTNPDSGIVITTISANSLVTISWQVQVNNVPPIPTHIVNIGDIVIPGGNSGMTNVVSTEIRTAYVTINKTVDNVYAQPGDVLTYTLTLNNAGNVVANNIIVTDAIPIGTSFIPGSLTGATGAFPNLTLNAPLQAGGTSIISYQVKIGSVVPTPNPIPNSASAIFSYTVDPTQPNGKMGDTQSNTVNTLVQTAKLAITKRSDKLISYIGDTITYQITVKNIGNTPADNVVITDILTVGTVYVTGSLSVNVPVSGDPTTGIILTNSIATGQTVSINFKVTVTAIPNPNPIQNSASATFTYTVNPGNPDGEQGNIQSNTVLIPVLRNNFSQQINDIIYSVALEQTALSAILNAEGAKVQRISIIPNITPEELLCLNKSITEMIESVSILENILKQKLSIIDCQINGLTC